MATPYNRTVRLYIICTPTKRGVNLCKTKEVDETSEMARSMNQQ